jgi:hypothetical protein
MNLTEKKLKNMIIEVISEAVLTEATFTRALEKINDEKKAFFVLSASRSERGMKHSRGNTSASKDLEGFFSSKALSFNKVDGGYTEFEKKLDPETAEPAYALDDDGKKIAHPVEEVSYLVFGDDPHYGDESNRIESIMELFEVAKEACMVDQQNPQESFSFGYPVHDEVTGETNMFIALYTPDAPSPGAKNAFTDWGGPWTSIQHFAKDMEGAYTKVRGGRSTFVEERLEEARFRKVATVNEGRKKQADISRWSKELNRLKSVKIKQPRLNEEVRPAPNSLIEVIKASYTAKAKGRKVKFIQGKK